jgi:hypothetical protein
MRGRIRAFALFIVLLHSGYIWATTGDTAQQDIAREFRERRRRTTTAPIPSRRQPTVMRVAAGRSGWSNTRQ